MYRNVNFLVLFQKFQSLQKNCELTHSPKTRPNSSGNPRKTMEEALSRVISWRNKWETPTDGKRSTSNRPKTWSLRSMTLWKVKTTGSGYVPRLRPGQENPQLLSLWLQRTHSVSWENWNLYLALAVHREVEKLTKFFCNFFQNFISPPIKAAAQIGFLFLKALHLRSAGPFICRLNS